MDVRTESDPETVLIDINKLIIPYISHPRFDFADLGLLYFFRVVNALRRKCTSFALICIKKKFSFRYIAIYSLIFDTFNLLSAINLIDPT